jgi:acyl dehydratase
MTSVIDVSEFAQTINYGLNKVRFISPVPVDSAVRALIEVIDVAAAGPNRILRCRVTLELRDTDKPACVAEILTLLPGGPDAEPAAGRPGDR